MSVKGGILPKVLKVNFQKGVFLRKWRRHVPSGAALVPTSLNLR